MRKEAKEAFILFLFSLLSWRVLGTVVTLGLMALGFGSTQTTLLLLVFVPYLLLLPTLVVGSRKLLGKGPKSLISENFRVSHALLPGAVYLLGLLVFAFTGEVVPDKVDLGTRLSSFVLVVLLMPVATYSEEVLFRVLPKTLFYSTEMKREAKVLLSVILSALLFTLPHLTNPEVLETKDGIYAVLFYFLWGMLSMALGIWDGGFEASVAIHTVNNLFVAMVVNYEDSALPVHALFLEKGEVTTYRLLVETAVLYATVFLTLAIIKRKEKQ